MTRLSNMDSNKVTPVGLAVAVVFASGPFLYLNIGGRGIFLYIAALLLAMMAFQVVLAYWKLTFRVTCVMALYAATVIWQAITFLWSPATSGDVLYDFAKIVVFMLLICTRSYTDKDKTLIASAQAIVAVVLVVVMLSSSYVTAQGRFSFDLFGTQQDPNYMCYFLMMPFFWCFDAVLSRKLYSTFRVVISIVLVVILAVGFLATGSRGALLGLLAGIVVYFAAYSKMGIKKIVTMIVFALLAMLLFDKILSFLPEEVAERFELENILASEGSGRYEIWADYIDKMKGDPLLLLVGHGSYLCTTMTATHNYILEVLFEMGICGLLLSVCFYTAVISDIIKRRKWTQLATITCALVTSLSLSVNTMLQFWLCIMSIIVLGSPYNEVPLIEKKENYGV